MKSDEMLADPRPGGFLIIMSDMFGLDNLSIAIAVVSPGKRRLHGPGRKSPPGRRGAMASVAWIAFPPTRT